MDTGAGATVLVVDDESQILELYRRRLDGEYDVLTAESGEGSLDAMDEQIDVVLLDRRMPGLSGGEALRRMRDAGHDQPVAMVTAIDPDFDVIEMGFDDYVVKPVTDEELHDVVESLLLRRRYDDVLREYFALSSKVAALQASKSPMQLASNPEYTAAVDELDEIQRAAEDSLEEAMEAGVLEELLWESHHNRPDPDPVEYDGGIGFH